MKHTASLTILFILICYAKANAQIKGDTISINGYLQMLDSVDKTMNAGNWSKASKEWESIVDINPTDGWHWYKLGESYYRSGKFDKAVDAFNHSLRTGSPAPSETAYFIARVYRAAKKKSESLSWLRHSFDLGYRHIMDVPRDTSFKEYFNDATFKQIVGLPLQPFKNREEGWRFDLALMVREVKRRAPNPFRHVTEKQFDSSVQALRRKIPFLSDIQLITEFEKILVLVGDGHTMIYAFFERPEFLKNLPLTFYSFEEGIFITEADKRYGDLLGTQVVAFDDKPIEDILKGMDPILNRDNELGPRVMGLMRVRTIPLLFGLGLVKSSNEVTLTIKDQQGKIKKIDMKADCPVSARRLWDGLPGNWLSFDAFKKTSPPLDRENVYTHYWFRYLKDHKTVYFQYNEMANDQGHPFNNFCDSLFTFIDENDVDKLIIDLALNHGGTTELLPYFIDKIISCKKIDRNGHLFGILGRRTYSATINLVGYLERFTPIIFLGEPTGSSPNFIGEDNPFELPYSKLMANVSDKYWQTSWADDQRQWFSPLIYIPSTFSDFAAGKNRAVEMILNYRNKQDGDR